MIRSISPFPFIDPSGKLHDGIVFEVNKYCVQCARRECGIIGYATKNHGEIQSCFKGADFVYLRDGSGDDVVWNGFLVKGKKYPKEYKDILRHGIEIDSNSFAELLRRFCPGGEVSNMCMDILRRGQSQSLHDLKHLVLALARVIERWDVREATESHAPTREQIQTLQNTEMAVYSILGAIKNQIELADFIVAPEVYEKVEKRPIDIYRLFDKNVRIYNELGKAHQKEIVIRGEMQFGVSTRVINETFQLLPAILLQNALKYSEPQSTVTVMVSINNAKVTVSVESFGPIVPDESESKIWDMGGQFVNPNDTRKGGSGFGLFLAKSICRICGFNISYDKKFSEEENHVPLGLNTFTIREL